MDSRLGVPTRIAIVAAVIFLLGAVAATFLPTSPDGRTCGTWFNREWDNDAVDSLVDQAGDLYDQGSQLGTYGTQFQGQAIGLAAGARENQQVCDDSLNGRRTITLVCLGLMVLVPASVWFVTYGRRGSVGT